MRNTKVTLRRENSGGDFTVWCGPGKPDRTIGVHSEPPAGLPFEKGLWTQMIDERDVVKYADTNPDYACDVGIAIQFDNEEGNYLMFNNPWIGAPWAKVNDGDETKYGEDSQIDVQANHCHFIIRRNRDSDDFIEFDVLISRVTP